MDASSIQDSSLSVLLLLFRRADTYWGSGELDDWLQNLDRWKGLQVLDPLGEVLGICGHSKWGTEVR